MTAQMESTIAAECDAALVTKWLLVAEVIDAAGARTLRIMSDGDLSLWDRVGLLSVATSRAYAKLRGAE